MAMQRLPVKYDYINMSCLKYIFLLIIMNGAKCTFAQKIESIHFNLYTDSLKKGFYNYINVDGHFSDDSWQPLDSNTLIFSANTGYFKGNDLFIDSSYHCSAVTVKAALKNNPAIKKEVLIYIRKRPFGELRTEEEVLNGIQNDRKKKGKN